MSSPFIAEIKLCGYNFAPRGYAFCNGQILPIAQNTALFSLVGTTYGGNGTTNFGLPNLQGRAALGAGQGPGLSSYVLGQTSGTPTVTLLSTQMPAHTHATQATTSAGNSAAPAGKVWAASVGGRTPPPLYSTGAPNTPMAATAIAASGAGQPHENRQPYAAVSFIIALQGVYPARN
jgi:microcystin-dependent protein